MADIETYDDIVKLVDTFYQKVVKDPTLGPAFNDVAQVDWPNHLPRMYQFWETVIFSKPGYKGNPAVIHSQLRDKMEAQGHQLTLAHFDYWIDLFQATVDELFVGKRADQAKRSAYQMGRGLTVHLYDANNFFVLRQK